MALSFQNKIRPVATTTAGQPSFMAKAKPVQTNTPQDFRFSVPETPQTRQNKIAQYQQDAQQASTESNQANSLWGMTKNFGKAFGSTIASSEVGLGQSLAKIIGAGDTTLTDAQQRSSDIELSLLKRINENKAKGIDTTHLQQVYNEFKNGQKDVNALVKEQYNLPTTGQVVGQIGGTALDLLSAGTYGKAKTAGMSFGKLAPKSSPLVQKMAVSTGLPELAPIAGQQAGGMFTKQGLKNIGTGLGIGYTSDVTQGLQGARGEDRTGTGAFVPGVGTLIGGGLPAISEGVQSVKNVRSGVYDIQRRSNQLENIGKRYNKVGEAFDMGTKKGVDVKKILSETNILNGAVDEDGLITAKTALENFDSAIAPYEGKVRDALQKENAKVQISDIASKMDDFVSKSKLQGESQTKLQNSLFADLKGLQSRYGDTIPVEALHDIKVFRGNASNYADTGANVINKDATRFFKEMVENNTRSFDVKGYNEQLSKLYTVKDAIEALDKKRVRGGRMGKFFASTVGAIVGGSTGNPFLSILGAEAGRMGQGSILEKSLGGDIAKGLEIPTELTNILTKKVSPKEVIPPVIIPKKNPVGTLNLQSNKVGNLNNTQVRTTIPITNVIPKTILPKAKPSTSISVQQANATNDAKSKIHSIYDSKQQAESALKLHEKNLKNSLETKAREYNTASYFRKNNITKDISFSKQGIERAKKEIAKFNKGLGAMTPRQVNDAKIKEIFGDLPVGKVISANAMPKLTSDTSEVVLKDLAKKHNVDYMMLNSVIDTKLSKAKGWKDYIDNEAEKTIQGITDVKVAIAPIKSKQRILEKTLKEEGGDIENIKDIARNTIVPNTAQARVEVLKRMDARKDILRRKDQNPKDFMGYEGVIYNIKTPDGQIVETQVVSPEMTFGKNLPEFSKSVLGEDMFNKIAKRTGLKPGLGHELYEKVRKLDESDPNYLKLLKQYTQESVDYYSKLM